MHELLQQILLFFGRGLCHQYAERSFEAGGLIFSVCSRDTGIYLGLVATLLVLIIRYAGTKTKPAAVPPMWAVAICVALAAPLIADGVSSYLGLRETSNLVRYISGYLCGMGLALIVSGGVFSLWARSDHSKSTLDSPAKLASILVASTAIGAAFYLIYPWLGVAAPLILFACIWGAFTLVNLLIVSTTSFWQRNNKRGGSQQVSEAGHSSGLEVEHSFEPEAEFLSGPEAEASGASGKSVIRETGKADGQRSPGQRILVVLLCTIAALVVLALFSLIASVIGLLLPWYVHP